MQTADFFTFRVAVASRTAICELICDWAMGTSTRMLFGINPQYINEAMNNRKFRTILEHADLLCADGVGIFWAMRLLGHKIPERATTTDLFPTICELALKHQIRLFFLGSHKGVNEGVAKKCGHEYAGIQIVGCAHGYFDEEKETEIIGRINACQPHILFVGMGAPKEQLWVWKHRSILKVPVIMTCGGMFDLLSGRLKRPPKMIQNMGLEWMGRLFLEPRRLWKRYLIGNLTYISHFCTYYAGRRHKRANRK